jgi:hypothetical protein
VIIRLGWQAVFMPNLKLLMAEKENDYDPEEKEEHPEEVA